MDGVEAAGNASNHAEAPPVSRLKRRRPTGYVHRSKFAVQCGNIQRVINRKKTFSEDLLNTSLKRCLTTIDMCLLGVGHMIGAGIYVLTGEVARHTAGPSVLVSYIVAGFTSFLAALCYAEFATRVPKAGSAYIYTYVTIGELWAFVIGWDVILEHMLGAASVARAWSGYLDDGLLNNAIKNGTMKYIASFQVSFISEYPDFVAFGICSVVCLLLVVGVKFSSIFNSIFTCANLIVIVFVVCTGFYYSDFSNWVNVPGGFFAFGFSGVIAGAGKCFFAFIGFDTIATSSEEAKTPARSIPLATFMCMAIATVAYCTMATVLTTMIPYDHIVPAAAFPSAFQERGVIWAKYAVSAGALIGMTTTMFGALFSLPRTVYAMATDGLLFSCFAYVNPRTKTPMITLIVCSLITALITLLFDISSLVEFMSIGTLMAYTMVSVSVIILRYQPAKVPSMENSLENATNKSMMIDNGGTVRIHYKYLKFLEDFQPGQIPLLATLSMTLAFIILCLVLQYGSTYIQGAAWWAILIVIIDAAVIVVCFFVLFVHEQSSQKLVFRIPFVPFLPALSVICNIFLMINLDWKTWVRFFVWMLLGMSIYLLYGIRHSKERLKVNMTISTTQLMMPEFIAPAVIMDELPEKDASQNEYHVTRF